MSLRFGILLFFFCLLLIAVIRSLVKGEYGGRFRTVTLTLLLVLLVLMITGGFYSQQHYSVDTVQSEFAADREEIMRDMAILMERGEYDQAWQLASRYTSVQDREFEVLARKSRELMLLAEVEETGNNTVRELEIYRELVDLRPLPAYQERLQTLEERQSKEEVQEILSVIESLPEEKAGLRMLGYSMLSRMVPDRKAFRFEMQRYAQQLQDRLDASNWISICSSSDVRYCQFVGYDALQLKDDQVETKAGDLLGEILGVVWRPRGTSIDAAGSTAPEDGYYYIVFKDGLTALAPCEKVLERGFPVGVRSEPVTRRKQLPPNNDSKGWCMRNGALCRGFHALV